MHQSINANITFAVKITCEFEIFIALHSFLFSKGFFFWFCCFFPKKKQTNKQNWTKCTELVCSLSTRYDFCFVTSKMH